MNCKFYFAKSALTDGLTYLNKLYLICSFLFAFLLYSFPFDYRWFGFNYHSFYNFYKIKFNYK